MAPDLKILVNGEGPCLGARCRSTWEGPAWNCASRLGQAPGVGRDWSEESIEVALKLSTENGEDHGLGRKFAFFIFTLDRGRERH